MSNTQQHRLNCEQLLQVLSLSKNATAVYTTEDMVIEIANDAMLAFWGKDRSIIGQPLEEGVPELKGQPFMLLMQQVLKTGITNAGIAPAETLINGKRQTAYYEYEYRAIKNEYGKPYCILHTATDVSEQITNRKTIQQQEAETKSLTQKLAFSNVELQVINVELANSNEEIQNINEELTASNEEIKNTNKELQETQEHLLALNAQLSQNQERMRLVIESANLGTWYLNAITREFIPSARLKELFGYLPNEDMSYNAAVMQITSDYRDLVVAAIEDTINHHQSYNVEYTVIGYHDGKLRWLKATGKLHEATDNTPASFTGTVADITEQKLEEQRKNDFIAIVSHELKTPLTSAKGYIQLMEARARKSGDNYTANTLIKVDQQIGKMTSLIKGFLDVARLESGNITLSPQLFDITEILSEEVSFFKEQSVSHQLMLSLCEPMLIEADKDKIGQVINNFISNALKYSPIDTRILISCLKVNDTVKVSVKDEGMGIKQSDIPKLFERFYRVDSSQTKNIAGFGIGLYLCAEIIQRHNGHIGVDSEIGKGSTFWFTLPLNTIVNN